MKSKYRKACALMFAALDALKEAGFKMEYWVECKKEAHIPFDCIRFSFCNDSYYIECGPVSKEEEHTFTLTAELTVRLGSDNLELLLCNNLCNRVKMPKNTCIEHNSSWYPKIEVDMGVIKRDITIEVTLEVTKLGAS